jgi:hypothetical protein
MRKEKKLFNLKNREIEGIHIINGGTEIHSIMMTVHVTNCGQENEDAEYDED